MSAVPDGNAPVAPTSSASERDRRPTPTRDAATVILVRHGRPIGEPWQCFMVRRHVRSDFAADVFVFPGGKVDPADFDPRLDSHVSAHPGPLEASEDRDTWRALRLAAIRELFEEAGVLLAARDGSIVSLADDDGLFARYRSRLQDGTTTLRDLAEAEGLEYALDRLHSFSRWITPETLPRRYDTRFFVAFLPEHQEPLHDRRETTDSVWISPHMALQRWEVGDFPLVFATRAHLERMARYHSIEELIASTSTSDLTPVMPKIVMRDGSEVFLLPGDPGY